MLSLVARSTYLLKSFSAVAALLRQHGFLATADESQPHHEQGFERGAKLFVHQRIYFIEKYRDRTMILTSKEVNVSLFIL